MARRLQFLRVWVWFGYRRLVVAGATFVVSVLVDGTDTSVNFLVVGIVTAGLPIAETMAVPPFGMPRLVCCNPVSSGVVVSGDGRVSVGVLGLYRRPWIHPAPFPT